MEYVDIVRDLVYAQRVSDWKMHLGASRRTLNLFAATGHCNYARCARLYLQEMDDLPQKHPWLSNKFEEGRHAVSRSGDIFTGDWVDMCIEQTLMESSKSCGGLTRGRGMDESTRSLWALSLSFSASIHEATSHLCRLSHCLVNIKKADG